MASQAVEMEAISGIQVEVRVRVIGELDVASAEALRTAVGTIIAPRCRVVLDLRDLRFCDCAGLRVITELVTAEQAAGGDVVLQGMRPLTERLIALVDPPALRRVTRRP